MRTTRALATATAILALLAATALAVGAQSPPASDPPVPVGFTGRIAFGPETTSGVDTVIDGRTETRGWVLAPTIAHMSDARLVGTVTLTLDVDWYPESASGEEVSLRARTWRIENDAGAWEGPDLILNLPDGSVATTSGVLTGEGAYEGLLVAWQIARVGEGWDVQGFIFPGDAPPGAWAVAGPDARQHAGAQAEMTSAPSCSVLGIVLETSDDRAWERVVSIERAAGSRLHGGMRAKVSGRTSAPGISPRCPPLGWVGVDPCVPARNTGQGGKPPGGRVRHPP